MCRAPDDGDWNYRVYGKLPPPGNIEAVPARYQFPDFCLYEATYVDKNSSGEEIRWAPANTQPRWASRLYLKIWDVDLHPLNQLTETNVQMLGQEVPSGVSHVQHFQQSLVKAFGTAVLKSELHLWLIKFRRLDLHFARRAFEDVPLGVPAAPVKPTAQTTK